MHPPPGACGVGCGGFNQRIVTDIENLYSQNHREKIFQLIFLNNNTLVIINNNNKTNFCYFSIENWSGNIIYCNKTLKIVFFDVTFFLLTLT